MSHSFIAAAGSRSFASLPVRRPRRFWDFHVPKTAWDYCPRMNFEWKRTVARQHERDLAVRDWITIPDARLPGPWKYNWSVWPYWTNEHPLEAVLSRRYALDNEPLTPIMFNSFDYTCTTVFARAKTGTFYLYYGPDEYGRYEERLYAFFGGFSSVEDFIEEADWNQMENVRPVLGIDKIMPSFPLRSVAYAKMQVTSTRGFRIAAEQKYSKRTLCDVCPPAVTFMYQTRQHRITYDLNLNESHRTHEWPCIPDSQLPEPWSCDWSHWAGSLDCGLRPGVVCPDGSLPRRHGIVPPGDAGTYYVWYNDIRDHSGPWGPWTGDMRRFEGVYASIQHFVQAADWNRIEGVAYREPVSYESGYTANGHTLCGHELEEKCRIHVTSIWVSLQAAGHQPIIQ
ncbi:hypothetical protein B0H19DRAFT_1373477 [Mycena capillaripes]|nr:hypothetical protein B0H19DRAFT_1373477 [Mycena capillaripes]